MLTPVSTKSLAQHLEDRAARTRSCAPADRKSAEDGIYLAYRAAGLPPPKRIVWCGGPVEIARRLAAVKARDAIGANVKAALHDRPRERVATPAGTRWQSALEVAGKLRTAGAMTALSVTGAVQDAADEILFRFALRARHAVDVWRGAPRWLPSDTFLDVAVGPDELSRLAVYEVLCDDEGWDDAEPLRGLWTVAASASWIVPYASVCWVAERPEVLRTDAQGRLHSPDGPALRYRDGWSHFAWKGVQVPAWMIEHPERITADLIDDEIDPVLRDTMIDIMTPERFIASGDPACISRDETGRLWCRRWTHRGVTIGSWAAVEVRDEDLEAGGKHCVLPVPAHFRSAREAVAWTYGMSTGEYARLGQRV